MYYIGFDLGDGESCLTLFDSNGPAVVPAVLPIAHWDSFPTAVAVMRDSGQIVIGRNALTNAPTIEDLRVCFKRDFKEGRNDVYESFRKFVTGVLAQLDQANLPFDYRDPRVCRFVVGQPADWDAAVLGRYRRLLENCGIADPYMVSESRAALVYVNTARYMESYDPMASATLVCDFGSSTLDFAYCRGGDQENVTIFGDPRLGGGLMDEQIVLESIRRIPDRAARKKASELFTDRGDIHSRLLMGARKIKEMYFLDTDREPLSQRVPIFDPELAAVTVYVDEEILNAVIMYPQPVLGGSSFYEQLQSQFAKAREVTREEPPKVIVLTGGASRMGFFRDICADTFRDTGASVIYSDSPDLDIACGLALDGSYLEKLQHLREALRSYADGMEAEAVVAEALPELGKAVADEVIDLLLQPDGVVRSTFQRWKQDRELRSLDDLKTMLEKAVGALSRTDAFSAAVEKPVAAWMDQVLDRIQDQLDAICLRVGVSPVHVQLKSGHFSEQVEIDGDIFKPGTEIVNVMDMIVTTITAAIVAVLAGGTGTAFVAAGPIGILVGLLIVGALRILLGDRLRSGIMKLKLLPQVRHMLPEASVFTERSAEQMKQEVAQQLAQQEQLFLQIQSSLADHIDAVVRAISCQTKV